MTDRLPFADDLYLACIDPRTRSVRAPSASMEYGLAGALLVELLQSGHVVLDSRLVVPARWEPPVDVLAHLVFDAVVKQPEPCPAGDWLTYLAPTAVDRVAERLSRGGFLQERRDRLSVRRRTYLAPTARAAQPPRVQWARYEVHLGRRLGQDLAVFVGLVEAAGLGRQVFWGFDDRQRAHAAYCLRGVDHSYQNLCSEVRAALAAAVLTHRA